VNTCERFVQKLKERLLISIIGCRERDPPLRKWMGMDINNGIDIVPAVQFSQRLVDEILPNVGIALLRQIPGFLYEGELDTTENYLTRSEELLGVRGTIRGHIYLHKGLLTLEEQPKKAKDYLETASEGFVKPMFYPRGLSEVFKEICGAYLMDDKKMGDEMALQYALVTVVLHPYGRNLELLQLATHKMYWRMGENMAAFNKFWRTLVEKLWRMESEPFSVLRHLMISFHENDIHYTEAALQQARKTVDDELYRK
jgi:hypothetical protein